MKTTKCHLRMLCAVVLMTWTAPPCLSAPMFQGLGDLPGGGYYSEAWDVSDHGRFVVGRSGCG